MAKRPRTANILRVQKPKGRRTQKFNSNKPSFYRLRWAESRVGVGLLGSRSETWTRRCTYPTVCLPPKTYVIWTRLQATKYLQHHSASLERWGSACISNARGTASSTQLNPRVSPANVQRNPRIEHTTRTLCRPVQKEKKTMIGTRLYHPTKSDCYS